MRWIIGFFMLLSVSAFAAPAEIDLEVASGEDEYVTITFTTVTGDPEDISSDSFYFAAVHIAVADTISVGPSAVTTSSSGAGVVDTISIKIADTVTASSTAGYYQYAIGRILSNGDRELAIRGTLLVTEDANPLGW